MILARCWRAIPAKTGIIKIPGSIRMIPNFRFASEHDFGFDTTNPINWQHMLENWKVDGKPLPRKTSEGHMIVYQVYDTKRKNLSLFPGYTKDGKKLPVYQFGYLK